MVRMVASLAAAILLSPLASAQEPVAGRNLAYGTVSLSYATSVLNGSGTTSIITPGVGVGVTFGVHRFGGLNLGLDLRASSRPGGATQATDASGSNVSQVLAGLKLSFSPPVKNHRLEQWLQVSGGDIFLVTPDVSSTPSANNRTYQYATVEVLLGMDYNLNRRIGIRLFEGGGGHAIGSGTFARPGTGPSTPGIGYAYFSSGIILHF